MRYYLGQCDQAAFPPVPALSSAVKNLLGTDAIAWAFNLADCRDNMWFLTIERDPVFVWSTIVNELAWNDYVASEILEGRILERQPRTEDREFISEEALLLRYLGEVDRDSDRILYIGPRAPCSLIITQYPHDENSVQVVFELHISLSGDDPLAWQVFEDYEVRRIAGKKLSRFYARMVNE